jgi:hypothetical protein
MRWVDNSTAYLGSAEKPKIVDIAGFFAVLVYTKIM